MPRNRSRPAIIERALGGEMSHHLGYARGCQDILIAATDGLKGMSEALGLCELGERKPAGGCPPADLHGGERGGRAHRLDAFEHGQWGVRFPTARLRKIIKTPQTLPHDEADRFTAPTAWNGMARARRAPYSTRLWK
jgi:hypothetical protein